MRDKHQRRRIVEQKILDPADRIDVEMVRGLVEQQQLRFDRQGPRKHRPPLHSRRKLGKRGVRVELEPLDRMLDLPLELPGALGIERGVQPIELVRRGGHSPGGVLPNAGQKRSLLAQTIGDNVEDGLEAAAGHFLRQPRHAQSGRAFDDAGIGSEVSGEELQQRRLPGSIAAHQADPLAGVDFQVDSVEQRGSTVAEREIASENPSHRVGTAKEAPAVRRLHQWKLRPGSRRRPGAYRPFPTAGRSRPPCRRPGCVPGRGRLPFRR